MHHFKLPTDSSLAKHKPDVFYSNIVVALGPKYEISSSVGSVILYSHEFPLSINFKRATRRRKPVCYGLITLRCLASSGNAVAHRHLLPLMLDVHQERTLTKDCSFRNELTTVTPKELWFIPEEWARHGETK